MLLDKNQQIAIELKYEGVTYKKIAKKLHITEDVVESWFRSGGTLEQEYLNYIRKHNTERVAEAMEVLKATTKEAAVAIQKIVERAINEVDTLAAEWNKETNRDRKSVLLIQLQKAEDRLVALSEKALDRGGLGIIRKIETNPNERGSKERLKQIDEELRKAGINPDQITFTFKTPTAAN